ncbi:translation initiation factor IF-2 [Candidatus Peregrinibacteria bacterium RIFOXYA2_FULL_33_7]|nr:MAG: translation initiation factor IF-2, translation initiation factor IF-2 [Candidatus Peregrinibacteria bacterium GW2011_GWC2_33_13]OGJ49902.1 MAG: translation initiation factor IF-2 [Candidatus Peregrinibacteria bacterium RIFOXYA2_FULL_33_7]
MSIKISSLAKKLGLKTPDLKKQIKDLGFEIPKNATEIEDDLADLILSEFENPKEEEKITEEVSENQSEASIYEEIYEKTLEKEIIKSQRKLTAGKERKISDESVTKEEEELIDLPKEALKIPSIISVKEFSEKTGVSAAKIIGELMRNGILASINQEIDFETASIIAEEFNISIKRIRDEASLEDMMEGNLENLLKEDDKSDLQERPPIVVVMGHVDHGKTQLLDYIRNTKVIAQESGGITQHIGAYAVEVQGKKITFIDTPGHEAFTAMRARGAKITDIAILVVAADEGVKEQTIEALNHAKEAKVPIIVAINKIDKERANIDKVKAQLAEQGLQPEDWGGQTICEPISALTGDGVNKLLEDILVVAELENLKANPNRPAVATVIEAHLDPSLGPTATIIVNTGTLKIMDNVVIGGTHGRLKVMKDSRGKKLNKIGPAQCAQIAGIDETPYSGDILQVVPDEKTARRQAQQIKDLIGLKNRKTTGMGIDEIIARINEGKMKTLKIILKADTKGSLEAIKQALSKVKNEQVAIQSIHSGVGQITESDVLMAAASKAIIIGFHAEANHNVKKLAERENVEILRYEIIYQIVDELKKLLTGLIEPEIVEITLGKLDIKGVFLTKKKEMIIGGKVTEGKIEKKSKFKLLRKGEEVGRGEIQELKLVDKAVNEVEKDKECGLKVNTSNPIQIGDILEVMGFEKRFKSL